MEIKFKLMLLSLTIIFSLSILGCENSVSDIEEEPAGVARVRFIHTAASQAKLDLTILEPSENIFVSLALETEYSRQRGYYNVIDGVRNFRVYPSGSNVHVSEGSETLNDEQAYTIISTDYEATINPTLFILPDTNAVPPEGKALVRFIHASADAPKLNVTELSGSVLIQNISRYQTTAYVMLDEGTYSFKAIASENNSEIHAFNPLTFIAGNNYSVIMSGSTGVYPGPQMNVQSYQEFGSN